MVRKVTALILIILLAASFTGCSKTASYAPRSGGAAKMAFYAESLDKLISESNFIVVGKVANNQKEYEYHGVRFVNTKISVEKALKGSLKEGEDITLLQTVMTEDPIVKKGEKVLLFMYKYEGPVTEDAYMCRGAYQGHYKIKGEKIIPSLDGNGELEKDVRVLKGIEELAKLINN